MRSVDIMMSIPAILLAVLTVAVLGPGFLNLVLVLGLTRWPRYTRVAYGQTLQIVNMPFIKASELAGAGAIRILFRHVLPNIAGPILIVATVGIRPDDPVRGRPCPSSGWASSRPRRAGARS